MKKKEAQEILALWNRGVRDWRRWDWRRCESYSQLQELQIVAKFLKLHGMRWYNEVAEGK